MPNSNWNWPIIIIIFTANRFLFEIIFETKLTLVCEYFLNSKLISLKNRYVSCY